MTYNAQTKQFEITPLNISLSATYLLLAMEKIRKLAGLPLDRYDDKMPISEAGHAQRNIILAAKELGINLGGELGNEIDLRKIE